MANSESADASVAAKAAQQLKDILEAIDSGSVTASAAQRAYLSGAFRSLGELAGNLSRAAEVAPHQGAPVPEVGDGSLPES